MITDLRMIKIFINVQASSPSANSKDGIRTAAPTWIFIKIPQKRKVSIIFKTALNVRKIYIVLHYGKSRKTAIKRLLPPPVQGWNYKDAYSGYIFSHYPYNAAVSTTICDNNVKFNTTAKFDNGSDNTIVCPTVSEAAVLQRIWIMKKITPVTLKVELSKAENPDAPELSLTITWYIPENIMSLWSWRLELLNLTILIADDQLVYDPVIIGLPELQNLKVNPTTIIDQTLKNWMVRLPFCALQ